MTELIWEGKYDKDGRKVAPLRVALPFQTIETVNESAQERQVTLDLFGRGRETEWRNRLVWGDNKYVLPALLAEFAGKVDLVYIDPPFATGQDFSLPVSVGGHDFVKAPSMIEVKAYRDTWGKGIASYLSWFNSMVIHLYELLAPTGSIYVHLDPEISHVIKVLLDEVFGSDRYLSTLVWKRTTTHSDAKRWSPDVDFILAYTKSSDFTFNAQFGPHDERYLAENYKLQEPDGRVYRLDNIASPNPRPNLMYEWKGFKPPAKGWRFSRETMERLDADNRVWYPDDKSKRPKVKRYLAEMSGSRIGSLWADLANVHPWAHEGVGYPTQKPGVLLERIINTATAEGDLVLDCVCGSGTTAITAEQLNRRWIAADLGRFAIHTTRKRLLSLPNPKPFVVQNLGKYERQLWQAVEFGDEAHARTAAYRHFILDLYKAKSIEGYTWLHGIRQGRLVHVGTVDSPVTVTDVTQIAAEFRRAIGTGADAPASKSVDVLGWDFAFEINEVARQTANRAGIDVHFWRIPREVLDKRATEQGDVRFFELAALGVEVSRNGRNVNLELTDFVIPTDDVPEDIQRAITDWSQWIDYWAVDWDNRSDTFHNQWQTYRTKKDPTLQKSVTHNYEAAGTYQVVVKVIDILGNDTTKSLSIEVA
jgi:adenine-specific DNA-methyltransferase